MTVGAKSKQKIWYLPKKVLTHCSPFFEAALNGSFVEASSKTVDLPDDDPMAFEMWATWLSLGKCKDSFEYGEFNDDYVRAWCLGDKLACPAFQDHVMSQVLEWFEDDGGLWLDTVQVGYEVSPPGSKLRRLFVDWFVWDKLKGRLEQDPDEIIIFMRKPPEFSDDVMRREVMAGEEINRSPLKEKHRYYENPAFKPIP